MSCLTPTAGSPSGVGCNGERRSEPWPVAATPGEDGKSSKRLIRDLTLTLRLSSSVSFAAISSLFLLLWSERIGLQTSSVLCGVVLVKVLSSSLLCGSAFPSGVLSTVFPSGNFRCSERPIDPNLEVRSAERGRLPAERGAGTGVSVFVVLLGKMADTGLGLEPLGCGRRGTDVSG